MAFLFVSASVFLSAEAENAKITAVSGQVYVITETGGKIPARINMPVNEDDEIVTEQGSCSFAWEGRVAVDMQANSKTRVTAPDEETDAPSIVLFFGKIFSKVQKISTTTSFNVVTPTAVAGVRGTEFSVVCADDGSTLVGVDSGAVEIEQEDSEKVVCAAGEKAEAGNLARLKKTGGYNRDTFDKDAWLKERREFLAKNSTQVFEHLEKKLDNNLEKFSVAEAKILKLQQNHKLINAAIIKAHKEGNQEQVVKLKEAAKLNFFAYGKTMKNMNQLRGQVRTQMEIAKKFSGTPEFADFRKNNAEKMIKIQKLNEKFMQREAAIKKQIPDAKKDFAEQKREHRDQNPQNKGAFQKQEKDRDDDSSRQKQREDRGQQNSGNQQQGQQQQRTKDQGQGQGQRPARRR